MGRRRTFVELDDPYEPNNLRSEAAPIEVGEPIDAYMFAGWETSSGIPVDEWHDHHPSFLTDTGVRVRVRIGSREVACYVWRVGRYAIAPLFRVALNDGVAPRACRRVGAEPSMLERWP